MLADEALKLMEFTISDYYRMGKKSIEYMSSEADELVQVRIGDGYVAMNITGDARFEYGGKTFEAEEDLDNRDDVVKKLRNGEIEVENSPWFEIQGVDYDGEFPTGDVTEFHELPPKLQIKGFLMGELKTWLDSSGVEPWLSQEMLELREHLPHFHTTTVKLHSNVRTDSIERIMTDFLVNNENLLSVVGCIEMEADWDMYEQKWFTIQFYCSNPEAVRVIRKETLKYGTTW